MSLVTQALLDLISEQIKAHGAVVWYDPEERYAELVARLTPELVGGASLHRYRPERGFMALRRELEPLWAKGASAPRLLIYVPLAQSTAHHALVEYEVGGTVMAPAQFPPECNTSLEAVARRGLAAVRPPAALEQIVAEVEAGKWTLAELDREAERGLEAQVGVLKLVFDTGNPSAIALRFLSDPAIDARITEKGALGTLAGLLSDLLGVPFRSDEGPAKLRERLARQVLVTDFVAAFGAAAANAAAGAGPLPPAATLPTAAGAFPLAERPAGRQAAADLAAAWRNRRDAAASYVRWADQIEAEIAAGEVTGSSEGLVAKLAGSETFGAAETRLQKEVELALVARPSRDLVALAEQRLGSFWSSQRPEIKARWDVIADAGRVVTEAERILGALKGKKLSAFELIAAYAHTGAKRTKKKSTQEPATSTASTGAKATAADGAAPPDPGADTLWEADGPWCILDTAQRHLERDFHRFPLDIHEHFSLLGLVAHARGRYAAAVETLAEKFLESYEAVKFDVSARGGGAPGGSAHSAAPAAGSPNPAALSQADVYARIVAPVAAQGRVAYLLVDAFRYEMARELRALLADECAVDLQPALAVPPTVTEIGMAALLPGAERGLAVVEASSGGLAAVVGGATLATRQERMDYFDAALKGAGAVKGKDMGSSTTAPKGNSGQGALQASPSLATARLDQLSPLTDRHLSDAIKAARVIVVTATEDIDGLCENTPNLARTMLDEALLRLRRAVKVLFGLGVTAIVISADHGYLFGEKLTSGEGIDPPGGKTVALKRRVWVGQGGAKVEGTLRAPLSAFGVGGALELVTPRGLAAFKAPGSGLEYFHGGLSLQELVVPVLTIRASAAQTQPVGAAVKWKLAVGSGKITTRFVSVTVEGGGEGLLPVEPPVIRVEVRTDGKVISAPVSASFGFDDATGDVKLARSDESEQRVASVTVTLMITETPAANRVSVHLLDASTGVMLASLDKVPFSISI